MVDSRVQKLRKMLQKNNFDAVLFTDLPSLRYFCGFTGSDGALLVTDEVVAFITDSRYTSQAHQEVIADRIIQHRGKTEAIAVLLGDVGAHTVGFDGERLSYSSFEDLRTKCPTGCDWRALPKVFKGLRGIKEPGEIAIMKQAAQIASEAFFEIRSQIIPGAVERDLALALEFAMRRRGAEEKSFPFIVASGQRGALPHGVASDRRLKNDELVTFDFGARWKGYCSDETVTLALGNVSSRLRDVYDIVFEAQQMALAAIKPGVSLLDIDKTARDYITDRGFGEYFGHGLGHGVGLEVHEFPVVSGRSENMAVEGMVFTVEPGIYIPELGGVRLEDTVLVTAGGYERVTSIPKQFSSILA